MIPGILNLNDLLAWFCRYVTISSTLKMRKVLLSISFQLIYCLGISQQLWQSELVSLSGSQNLIYKADSEGNTLPDFSRVGYASGDQAIPNVTIMEIVSPVAGDNLSNIQNAINRVSLKPLDANGFRGAILLKKGVFAVNGSIVIEKSGIVIRGEGESAAGGTIVRETATTQVDLFIFRGSGSLKKIDSSKIPVAEDFVPVGRKQIMVSDASSFSVGDSVLLCRPATDTWIHDLKMDQIDPIEGTVQWTSAGYNLFFERIITACAGNKITLDHPIVMQMDKKYGGGYLMHYHFNGRIRNCGIENLRLESAYKFDTDENHGWNAINLEKIENSWVQNVTSIYFGMGCVTIADNSRNISVLNSQCLDAKSIITGSRRYSFNCNGQLNLFKNCYTTEGRHDYVTGSRVCGPNVFTQSKSVKTHADIGPHHRWASGTLYDVIETDGEINVQDRGNWGTGHGWAGVTQVIWNCKSPKVAVQSPWVSGRNYCIGLTGVKYAGRLGGRPDGVWEGQNKSGLVPESLYEAQLKDRALPTAVIELSTGAVMRIFPNPSEGKLLIAHEGSQVSYSVFRITGEKVISGRIAGNPAPLDLSSYHNGIYIVECVSERGRLIQKIIIQK